MPYITPTHYTSPLLSKNESGGLHQGVTRDGDDSIGSAPVLRTGASRERAEPIEPVPRTGSSGVLEPNRPNRRL